MKITYMNELPELEKFKKRRILNMIENFYNRSESVMKITWDEESGYKSAQAMHGAFNHSVRRSKRPIKVMKDENDVYLIKILDTETE